MSYPLCILVANGSQARAFQRNAGREPLVQLAQWVHPQTRVHASELTFDHPGPGHAGRGGLAPRVDIRHKARSQFAQQLIHWIEARMAHQEMGCLALFASNPFLGELMVLLPQTLHQHVCARHPTDLTSLPIQDLDHRLRHEFRL